MPWKEALEAFADERNWRFGGRFDPNSPNFNGIQTAKDALDALSPPATFNTMEDLDHFLQTGERLPK